MRKKDLQRLWALVDRLSRAQRQEVIDRLKAQATTVESIELVESARHQSRSCPHCGEHCIVRNDQFLQKRGLKRRVVLEISHYMSLLPIIEARTWSPPCPTPWPRSARAMLRSGSWPRR